jgi:hypothetical protein
MPTVTVNNTGSFYAYYAPGSANFASHVSHTSTQYVWLTSDGHKITATGTGITVDAQNVPTAGTITSIQIDIDNSGNGDIQITGLAIDLATVNFSDGLDTAEF